MKVLISHLATHLLIYGFTPRWRCRVKYIPLMLTAAVLMLTPRQLRASLLNLGPEELIQAKGSDIQVPGYSVPCLADWNNDGLADLIIGEGGSTAGKVRIYLNVGTSTDPEFADYFYAQSNGADLTVSASGAWVAFRECLSGTRITVKTCSWGLPMEPSEST